MISGSKVSHKIRLIVAIRRLILFLSIAFAVAFLATRTLAEDKVVELKFTLWGSPFEKQAIEKAVASFNASVKRSLPSSMTSWIFPKWRRDSYPSKNWTSTFAK